MGIFVARVSFSVMMHGGISVVCVLPWRRVPPPTLGQWQMTDKGWLGSSFYICSDTHLSTHPKGLSQRELFIRSVPSRFSSCSKLCLSLTVHCLLQDQRTAHDWFPSSISHYLFRFYGDFTFLGTLNCYFRNVSNIFIGFSYF